MLGTLSVTCNNFQLSEARALNCLLSGANFRLAVNLSVSRDYNQS